MPDDVTLTGRFNNFFSSRAPAVAKWFARRQAGAFERSGGAKANSFMGRPTFRLTVVGRTSGEPRSVMLMLARRGDDLLVCGSQGGAPTAPNWWHNLMAARHATVQVGGERWDVYAREVTDPDERAVAWSVLTAAYPDFASYQALTERVLPIAVLSRSPAAV